MNDSETRVNWRDMTAAELDLEIARRLGLPMDEPTKHLFYTTDLDAAASLPLPGDRVFMEFRRWNDGLTEARVIDFPVWQTHHPEYHREKSTAMALCKAWLAWHDAKSAHLSPSDTDESQN